jgi:hypothetical protein
VLHRQRHSAHKHGPKPRIPRLKVKNLPTIEARNMVKYGKAFRKQPWEKFYVKDSTLGPVVWEAKAAPIYLKRDGLPTWPHWLIVARNMLDPNEVKYFVSIPASSSTLPGGLLDLELQPFQFLSVIADQADGCTPVVPVLRPSPAVDSSRHRACPSPCPASRRRGSSRCWRRLAAR